MTSFGLMYPGITEVKITEKKTGKSKTATHAQLKKALKPKDFERLSHEVFMWGEFEDANFKVTIHKQERDYDINHCFM